MAVTYEVAEGIATLTLNRPERLNAFNDELVRGALAAIDKAKADPAVKALVLTGNGRGFCAGADLAGGLAPTGEGVNAAMRDLYNPLILAIDAFPKPTVAAINGVAAGAGVGLALACDIAVAARSASFVLTFGPQLGLVPDLGVTWFLPRAIGRARARALALLGDKLPAATAANGGSCGPAWMMRTVCRQPVRSPRASAAARRRPSSRSAASWTRRRRQSSRPARRRARDADRADRQTRLHGGGEELPCEEGGVTGREGRLS